MSKLRSISIAHGFHLFAVGILLAAALTLGCSRQTGEPFDTRYGNSRRAKTSINGTSLFVEKIRERGCEVDVKKKIAPSMDRYDTVFWFPASRNAPQQEAIDRIMDWFEDGYDRTFVYVGGGYDASIDYYARVVEMSEGADREEALRRLAEAKIKRKGFDEFSIFNFNQQREDCDWFDNQTYGSRNSNDLSGPLTEAFADELPSVSYEWLFEPKKDYQTSKYYQQVNWKLSPLLTVDGNPFISKLESNDYDTKRIFLISNGALLVNYGMVIPEREKLADRLLDRISPSNQVLILESGPQDIKVSDSDFENHNLWAWIAEAPLKYIVPHFLFWGVIFCFVLFPIFGRPRNEERDSTTSFRNHVNAVGKQLGRTGRIQQARASIDHYQTHVADKGKPRT